MNGEILVSTVIVTVTLLLIAAVSAIFLKKINFPYTIGLVVVGIAIAVFASSIQASFTANIRLTPEIILYILLPTLIFEAAVNIDSRLLTRNLIPVLALAAPGLIVSTAIVGGIMALFSPLSLGTAMLFGALISATDPVAVISLFKKLGAPTRLTMLVDGESLFNDATAIVMFNIVIKMIAGGAVLGFSTCISGGVDFIVVFFGGLALGGFIGWLAVRIIYFAKNDPMIQLAMSVTAAYASFILADHWLKVSGVMSVVGAGMVISWYGSTGFSREVKRYLNDFWEFAAFAANSLIFLLLGLTEDSLIFDLFKSGKLLLHVGTAVATCFIARAVIIYGILPLTPKAHSEDGISLKYKAVMLWGGLRGAVPMALVLSLKPGFEHRQLLIELTLGVVLFTLLVQGTTIRWLIVFLGLDKMPLLDRILFQQARLDSNRSGLEAVSMVTKHHNFKREISEPVKNLYSENSIKILEKLEAIKSEEESSLGIKQLIWLQTLSVAKKYFRTFFDRGILDERVMKNLDEIIAVQFDHIRENRIPPKFTDNFLPLELKIKRSLFIKLNRLFPESGLVRKTRKTIITTDYEVYSIIIEATHELITYLRHLEKIYPEHKEDIFECIKFITYLRKTCYKKLETLEKLDSKDVDKLKSLLLRRIACDAELKKIRDMAAKGEITENITEKLESEVRENLLMPG